MSENKFFLKPAVIFIVICCLCFAGCGAGTPDQDPGDSGIEAVEGGAETPLADRPSEPVSQAGGTRILMLAQHAPEGREIVSLGIYGSVNTFSPMYLAVDAFNQAQEKYFVQIEMYYGNYSQFIMDIIRNQGTDLYNLFVGIGDFSLVEKGILEDLTPYIEGSDVISRENIVDAVWRAGSVDDKLYFLIPYFECRGVLAEKAYTKEGAWSGKEYIELGKKYPDSMLNEYVQTPTTNILMMLKEYIAAFVDWEDMDCSFESDEFIALLEDLKALSDHRYEPADGFATVADRIRGKAYLSMLVTLGMDPGMYGYRDVRDAFGDSYVIAGKPSADGSLRYELYYDQIYGMNAASGNKEGAWAFLEYLLSEEYQRPSAPGYSKASLLNGHFPVRKDLLEWGLQVNVDYLDSDEKVVNYHINAYSNEKREGYGGFTEEDKEAVLHMIDNSYKTAFGRGFSPLDILMEESEPFFQGQKSAEDVAKIIQNRVSLYLMEQAGR